MHANCSVARSLVVVGAASLPIANALMLFFAGFDTQAIAISLVLHYMVINEDVQNRLIDEVDDALEASGGHITYDLIEGLKYMDMVFKESFR